MKLSLLKLTTLVVLVLTTTAYGQQQGMTFNFFGGGARSEGMGQAYIAISDDATAGGWNPAGLYVHEKTFTGFSYSFLMPRGNYQFYVTRQRQLDYGHEGSIGGINNWSIITPMRIKGHHFVFNLSTTRYSDVYFKFGEKLFEWSDSDPDNPDDNADPNAFLEKQGAINAVNLSFGTRVWRQFAFGVTGNIYYGRVITDEKRLIRMDTTIGGEDVVRLIDSRVIDSTKFSGFNANIGLLYAGEKMRAGLLVKMPFTLRGESDSTLNMITTRNGVQENQTGMPFRTQIIYIDNMTSKIEMPLMLGVGLAYKISDNWLVSGDAEYRGFSGKITYSLDSLRLTAAGDKEEFFTAYDPNWSDVISLRLGTEYVFKTSFAEIPVRAGARKENFPEGSITDYAVNYEGSKEPGATNDSTRVYYNYNFADNRTRGYSISLGTGIHLTQILFDIAYTYSNYEQGIWLEAGQIRSKNIWKNHHFNISFTGYF